MKDLLPKEKAHKIWLKYWEAQMFLGNMNGELAYQCSIIEIDAIIDVLKKEGYVENDFVIKYWEEVKKEL